MERTAQNWNDVTPRFESQRSAHYRSTVIETLRWFCSELSSTQIPSALEDLFSEAPLCKLTRLGIHSGEPTEGELPVSYDHGEPSVECDEMPFYSETSAAPCTLVQLELAGVSVEGTPWEARLQLAVSVESTDVWQTILRSISVMPSDSQAVELPESTHQSDRDSDFELRDEEPIGNESVAMELAHALRNPLGSIMTAAELLAEADGLAGEDENSQLIDIIQSQSARIDKMLIHHVDACKVPLTNWTRVDLGDLLSEAASSVADHSGAPQVDISQLSQKVGPNPLVVKSDGSLLLQVLHFLVAELPSRLSGCGSLKGRIQRKGDSALMQLEYVGDELRPEILRKVVLPFSTTKDGGSGLDAPPIHSIIRAIGGEISLASSKSGTVLTIALPASRPENRNCKYER